MKKLIIILLFIGVLFSVNTKEKAIPKKSIRFRVISNSNNKEDIEKKIKVKNVLTKRLEYDLKDSTDYNSSMEILKSNKNEYDKLVHNELKNNDYKINLGKNYFPAKEYKGTYYKSGKYDSLIVTIGKGEGKNFWCVLFPPLCFIDEDKGKDIEYHSFFKDVIDKILK